MSNTLKSNLIMIAGALIAGLMWGTAIEDWRLRHDIGAPVPPCAIVTERPAKMDWECSIIKNTNPARLTCYLPEGAVIEVSQDKGHAWVKVDYLRINQQILSPRFAPVSSGR